MVLQAIERFAAWFQSAAGVWQTTAITLGVVALEFLDPRLDPHGFWLLYWLTVYSAVTQPALAYVGAVAAQEARETARTQLRTLQALVTLTQELQAMSHREDERDARVERLLQALMALSQADAKDLDAILAWVRQQEGGGP